jgi:hypothetical protein
LHALLRAFHQLLKFLPFWGFNDFKSVTDKRLPLHVPRLTSIILRFFNLLGIQTKILETVHDQTGMN